MNSTSEDKYPSAGVHISSCNPWNLFFVWEQWNSSLMGILWYLIVTRTKLTLHYLLPPNQLFTLCARTSEFWYHNLPALFNSNWTKSKRSSGRTHCTHIYARGVWRSLDSLARQAKVLRNFMWISTLFLLWCGEKEAPALSATQFSPVLYYTLHQIWKMPAVLNNEQKTWIIFWSYDAINFRIYCPFLHLYSMMGKVMNWLVSGLKNLYFSPLQRKFYYDRLIGQEFVYVSAWKTIKNYFHSLEETIPFIVEKFVYTDVTYLQPAFLKQMTA